MNEYERIAPRPLLFPKTPLVCILHEAKFTDLFFILYLFYRQHIPLNANGAPQDLVEKVLIKNSLAVRINIARNNQLYFYRVHIRKKVENLCEKFGFYKFSKNLDVSINLNLYIYLERMLFTRFHFFQL